MTWLDKLEWTDGESEPEPGLKIKFRQADVTPYYVGGTNYSEHGQYEDTVILTEWPTSYTLDVYREVIDGSESAPWDAMSETLKYRIFRILRSRLLKMDKEWWRKQRHNVYQVTERYPEHWSIGTHVEWRPAGDDPDYYEEFTPDELFGFD